MAKKKDTSSIAEMRGKDSAELRYELGEMRKELFNARFQPDTESTDTSHIRNLRRTIARMITVLRERETAEAKAPQAAGGES